MKRRNLLIGAAVVFAVGGARLVRGWRVDGPEHPGSPTPSPPRPQAPGTLARMRADVAPIRLEADPSPAGALHLQGLVLGSDDAPAGEAVVSLGTTPPRITRTDKAGSFDFDKLVAGPYRLEARGRGTAGGPVAVHLDERSGPVTLRLRPAASVEATAVDARTHKALSAAVLELRGDEVLSAPADESGTARFEGIRPGKYVVKASAHGHSPVLHALSVADASVLERVTLELGSGAAASGEVRDARGQPVAGIPVVAELSSAMVALADARADGVVTDDHGRFRFAALAAGTYRFLASDAAHAPASSQPIALDGAHDRDAIVIRVEDSARISGRVVSRSGGPIAFALVRAVVNEGMLGQALARQTQCDDKGQFTLGGLPRKAVDVVALHESATSGTHKLNLTEKPVVSELILPLDADGTISGSVIGAGDQPVADAVVIAEPAATSARSRAEVTLRGKLSAQTDDGGKFQLRGLPGGSYLVRAAPPGSPLNRRTSWLRTPIKVDTPSKGMVLRLEADGRLKGVVAREGGGAPDLFTVTVDGAGSFVGGGGSGEFAIHGVPPGAHGVTISGANFVTRSFPAVEIKPDVETDMGAITVGSGRRITGRVLREDGSAVPGASVTVSRALNGPGVVVGPSAAQAADMRQTVSQDDGTYSVGGLGIDSVNLGAEHAGDGRSSFVAVPPGTDEVKQDLVLKAAGALRGTITQQGQPASGALVLASARGAPAGGTGVTTGTDGSYVFEALTPGSYIVAVMLDAGGGHNIKQGSAAVRPGEATRLDLDLPLGSVTLVVHPVFQTAAPTAPTRITLVKSDAASPQSPSGGAPSPSLQTQVVTGTEPARFSNVEPGEYRVCASPVPPTTTPGTPPEGVKGSCEFTTVAQGPALQETNLVIAPR